MDRITYEIKIKGEQKAGGTKRKNDNESEKSELDDALLQIQWMATPRGTALFCSVRVTISTY